MSITRFSSLSYLITVILCKWRWAECLSYNDYRNVQTSIGRRSYAVDNRFYPNSRKIWRRPPQFRDVGDFNGGFPPAIAPVFDAPTFSNFAPQSQSNFPQSQQFNYGGANQLQQQQNYQPQQAPYQPPQSSFQRQQQPYQQQYQNVQPTYRQPQSPSGYGGSYGPSCSPQTSSGNTYGGSSYGSGSVGGSITYGGSAYFPVLPQIDLSRCFTRYTETEIRGYQGFFVAASANIEECLAMCLASAVNYEGQICASIVFIPKNHSCELFNITGRNPPAILYMKYGHDYYEPTNCPGCYIGTRWLKPLNNSILYDKEI